MPDAVFTQTIPLLLAGGVCCAVLVWVLAALLVAAGAAGELVVAGAPDELLCGALAGAGFVCGLLAGAGAAPAAGVLVPAVSDFFVPVFLVVLAELPASAGAVLSEVAAFFDLLLDVPLEAVLSDAVLSDPLLSAASAAFLELPFLVAGLLSAELSELAVLFLDFDLEALALSPELAELSAASVLFLLLDLVVLLLAVESVPLCVASSAVVFFLLLFFFVVVELSLWSCEPDEPACCAPVIVPAHKSKQAARSARTAPLLDLISASSPFFAGGGKNRLPLGSLASR